MADLRALLLTDVVDSTRLVEELGDARMAEIWIAHDRAVRDLLPAFRGQEADRTDGFLLLFAAVADAVGFAVAFHREMAALGARFGVPFAARVGIHLGSVILIETSAADRARGAKPLEVEGLAKPYAARVMSVADAGQTLLSAEALGALGETALRVVSHGHWQMKGVAEPVELFEVGNASAPFAPPPDGGKVYRVVRQDDLWVPVRRVPHRLPAERDAFFGRRQDLQDLAGRLGDGQRLISVLGAGGTGKTRLVTRLAWTRLGDYPGGAWFCDLSDARDVDGIVQAVARVLDVPLGGSDPVAQLAHVISRRGRCLVVLDNFEQVTRHAERTLGVWLDAAAEAQFVVTSRELLGLAGEAVLALAPLPPTDAEALFLRRAESARRDLALSAEDRAAVGPLVRLLDGLPLAIELAAARVRVMPPAAVLARMGERFKLLTSSGGRRERQATLRGAIDWSWDLLSEPEKAALTHLSVFEGGFTLGSAEAILDLTAYDDAPWPLDAVQSLVDKSLVRPAAGDRFDLLVSVKEYARERLGAAGQTEAAEARHAAWFASRGDVRAPGARTALVADLDNLLAACRRAVARGDADAAIATLEAAGSVIQLRGPYGLGLSLARDVLAMPDLSVAHRARAGRVAGQAAWNAGRLDEAQALYDATLPLAREAGDRRTEAGLTSSLGVLVSSRGRMDEARVLYDAALALHRELGDRSSEATLLGNISVHHYRQGRADEAWACGEEALAVARKAGDRVLQGHLMGNLGGLLSEMGRMDEARAHHEAALAIHREVGDRVREDRALGALGSLGRDLGRLPEARAHMEAALAVHREMGNRQYEAITLSNLGDVDHAEGRYAAARAHLEAALALHGALGARGSEGVVLANLAGVDASEGRPDAAIARYEVALERAREVGNRRFEGHVLGELGALHRDQGRLDEARRCFDVGEALLRENGDPLMIATALLARVELEVAAGDVPAARRAFVEAEVLAGRIGAGPGSELEAKRARARSRLGVG